MSSSGVRPPIDGVSFVLALPSLEVVIVCVCRASCLSVQNVDVLKVGAIVSTTGGVE